MELNTTQPVTPMTMLSMAVSQNADLDKLEKLMQLQERWEANEARKAFVLAMNAFKANPPVVTKNKHVEYGKTKYDHATLDNVSVTIGKALSEHGISHRWKIDQGQSGIKVTCILSHAMGHSEEVSMVGPTDDSGGKNNIQAVGSTVTYLQRYTLLASTGMAAEEQDDDAQSTDSSHIDLSPIEKCKTLEELMETYAPMYRQARATNDKDLLNSVIAVYEKRKAELVKA